MDWWRPPGGPAGSLLAPGGRWAELFLYLLSRGGRVDHRLWRAAGRAPHTLRLATFGNLWMGCVLAPPGGPRHCTSLGARLLGGQVLLAGRVEDDCLAPGLLLGGGLLLLLRL